MNARIMLMFHDEEPCIEKNREEDSDVLMGCHDGAKILELVGTFILNRISVIMQEHGNIGLYRDDGLGIFRNLLQPNVEKRKRDH